MDTRLPPSSHTRSIDRLEKLHRGEVAALTTYAEAMRKDGAPTAALSRLRDDHRAAAARLSARIVSLGGMAPTEEGTPWEAFAQAVQGTATLFGNRAALQALRLGENHGVDQYADAMGDPHLDAESRAAIDGSIARQKLHIAEIDAMLRAR